MPIPDEFETVYPPSDEELDREFIRSTPPVEWTPEQWLAIQSDDLPELFRKEGM